MDMMMTEREGGGEEEAQYCRRRFGFNGGFGGDGRCGNQDVYYSGNQLSAGTGGGAASTGVVPTLPPPPPPLSWLGIPGRRR